MKNEKLDLSNAQVTAACELIRRNFDTAFPNAQRVNDWKIVHFGMSYEQWDTQKTQRPVVLCHNMTSRRSYVRWNDRNKILTEINNQRAQNGLPALQTGHDVMVVVTFGRDHIGSRDIHLQRLLCDHLESENRKFLEKIVNKRGFNRRTEGVRKKISRKAKRKQLKDSIQEIEGTLNVGYWTLQSVEKIAHGLLLQDLYGEIQKRLGVECEITIKGKHELGTGAALNEIIKKIRAAGYEKEFFERLRSDNDRDIRRIVAMFGPKELRPALIVDPDTMVSRAAKWAHKGGIDAKLEELSKLKQELEVS